MRHGVSDWATCILIVLPPCVFALAAPEEPDLRFIGSPELPQPPEGGVVAALGAPDRDGGERRHLLGVVNDGDLPLSPGPGQLEAVILGELPDEPAFPALHLASGGDHQGPALGAEHLDIVGDRRT